MKYIRKFSTLAEAQSAGAEGLASPHVDLIDALKVVNICAPDGETFTCEFDSNGILRNPTIAQSNNEIWYTTTDGKVIGLYDYDGSSTFTPITGTGATYYFGASLVSNTYSNGKGVLKFSGNVTKIIGNDYQSIFYDDNEYSTLKSIVLPNTVTTIGSEAFSECENLVSVNIPSSVTSIGSYAFRSCTALTSITIPNSVTSIQSSTFSYCKSLTGITIPDSVTSIESYAFQNCTGLTGITIPNSVTSIGNDAFFNCTALTGITIPSSVTSIGTYAFRYCENLISITYTGTKAQWNSVIKGGNWNYNVPATVVHCTDGDVSI